MDVFFDSVNSKRRRWGMGTAVFSILFRLISLDGAIDGIRNGDFQKWQTFHIFSFGFSVEQKHIQTKRPFASDHKISSFFLIPFCLFHFLYSFFLTKAINICHSILILMLLYNLSRQLCQTAGCIIRQCVFICRAA